MSTEISTQRAGGLALQTFDDAFRFSKMVSASEFAPKDFKGKPESCLLAIQHGAEVGLSPMQSLQSIAVINGRPTIWGDAALALVQSSPVCEYVKEYTEGDGDNLTAVCECKRRGYPAPTVSRFSMADAKRAGLAGKSGPWSQYPARMLALRARGFALRNAFADCLRGLITAEEARDYPTQEPAKEPIAYRPKGTKSQDVGDGITVHHVESFEPLATHKPEIHTDERGVVRLKTERKKPEITDPVGKARLAVSKAATLDDCNTLRDLITTRHTEGVFTDADRDELVKLLHHRAEMLIESEDAGTETPAHEVAHG